MKHLLMVVFMLGMAHSSRAGWYFESSMTIDNTSSQRAGMFTHTAKSWLDGERIRTEFIESSNPIMPAGSYMISTDGGKNMNIIDPEKRTITTMNFQEMADMATGMMSGMMRFTSPSFEITADEDADEQFGLSVRRHAFRMTYTAEMNMFGMRSTTQHDTTQEMWVAPDIQGPSAGFTSGHSVMKLGDAAFDQRTADAMSAIKGLPLKIVITSLETRNGATQQSVTQSTITRLEKQSVPDSKFAIPGDLTPVSLIELSAGAASRSGAGSNEQQPAMDPRALQEMLQRLNVPRRE